MKEMISSCCADEYIMYILLNRAFLISFCCTNESMGVNYLNALIPYGFNEVRIKVNSPHRLVYSVGCTIMYGVY
jgi:hypothetical protein